jgi:hypothetical protein
MIAPYERTGLTHESLRMQVADHGLSDSAARRHWQL